MIRQQLSKMRNGLVISMLLLGGCTTVAQTEALQELRDELQTLKLGVDQSSSQIAELQAIEAASDSTIGEQIVDLNSSIGDLRKTIRNSCRQTTTPTTANSECKEVTRQVIMSSDDKMLLGDVEQVWIDPPGLSVVARIDTGASSSSLHAANITPFERDGEDWVRFEMGSDQNNVTIERPVKKYVRVYQQADKSGSRRPVVDIRLFLGDVKDTFAFTLADRSHLQHDMILGRNFLTDMALVDVSQQFVQPAYKPEEE